MVNASGHIEQQLSKLQIQTADIATELETLVDKYLQVLSQASKRQLVLAAYHVCTQVYPDKFLELSLSQRDRLQQELRELGNRIQSQLRDKWDTAKRLSLRPAEEDGLAVIRQLFLEAASARDETDMENSADQQDALDEQPTQPAPEEPKANVDETIPNKRSQEKLLAEIQTLIGSERLEEDMSDPENETTGPMQPAQIMRRQILIEKAIRDVLKTVSEKANDILQKASVMPELPKALLAAASDAERLGHIPMKTPNLVRLSIKVMHEPSKDSFAKHDDEESDSEDETQSDQWPDEAEISAAIIAREDDSAEHDDTNSDNRPESISMPRFLQLDSLPDFVMIHLRLSEIEFAETNVAIWRSRIRKKMGHLKQVGHAYKDAERQLAIAQAEDAWRASWTND
ncbi:hypothetical protein [Leptothoe spongobia]|uniref:Uncharacterized protein n=1 Tax=Leptothoe spongobia TAU-MAC 1115 TaxID=1967444 RepID=A0A947DBY3_9CYAN|nr:hypothetical protein [Leptothoe spongobia]MBT9314267.1 hypothetical protein [Leptothoe spongobia TAU-MAC 1115]